MFMEASCEDLQMQRLSARESSAYAAQMRQMR
jgi:hypothetical protein